MGTNVAENLLKQLESTPSDRPLRVNIHLRSDLTAAETQEEAERIRRLAGDAPFSFLASSKTITASLPPRAVERIAQQDNVFWVDLDHEAAIRELIDPEPGDRR